MTPPQEDPRESILSEVNHVRILLVTDSFHPQSDSAASHLFGRASLWAADGHEVDVLAGPGEPLASAIDRLHVTRTAGAPNSRSGSLLRRAIRNRRLPEQLFAAGYKRPRPDVVLCSMPPLSIGTAAMRLAEYFDVPLVVEVRDLWPDSIAELTMIQRGSLIRRMAAQEKQIYHAATKLFGVTKPIAQRVRERSNRHDVAVVHTGADTSLFKPRAANPDMLAEIGITANNVVGYLGTVGRACDIRTLCSIALDLQKQDTAVLIVGSGSEVKKIRRAVRRKALRNVHFVDVQPRAAMPIWWSVCTAAIVPLRDRPVLRTVRPMKMYEGMAMGIPLIVASSPGEATQWVEDAGAGLAIPPENSHALLNAINTLIRDEQLRKKYAQAGVREAVKWTRIDQAVATMSVLRKAIDQCVPASASTKSDSA